MSNIIRSSRPSLLARHWVLRVAGLLILLSPWAVRIGAQRQEFLPPGNGTCACLNQNLTYTCTVEGAGVTVWSGTAFVCPTQEVTLRHTSFGDNSAFGICNDGTVTARSVNVSEDRYYTSELVANITSELNGSAVSCVLRSGSRITVGSAQIIIRSGPYQRVPVVRLTQANTSTLTFIWDSVDPSCPSISYEMTTSGCGTCSIATNTTTATCTGWQLGNVCNFSVWSIICGFTGMPSVTVSLAIKVPHPPQTTIIPVYSAGMDNLMKLFITINQLTIDSVTGTVYTTSYFGGVQRNTSCTGDQCEYEVRGPFQDCSTSSTTSVSVSASNVFGQGQASSPKEVGCTNQFVQIDLTSSAIVCRFLNTMDTSVKSCTVTYGSCDQNVDGRRASGNSTVNIPNVIEIQLDSSTTSLDCFMYSVTASNDTHAVIVEDIKRQRRTTSQVVIIATVVPIVLVLVAIIVLALIIIIIPLVIKVKRTPRQYESADLGINEESHNPPGYIKNPAHLAEVYPHLQEGTK